MKTQKLIQIVAIVCLLLGASVQAQTVIFDPGDPTKAIGIENLEIGGVLFNVEFTGLQSAAATYGAFPGVFNPAFDLEDEAALAMDAVDNALTAEGGVLGVGAEALDDGSLFYYIGFGSEVEVPFPPQVFVWFSARQGVSSDWERQSPALPFSYNDDDFVWADFTVVPEPCTAMLLSLGGLALFRRKKCR
jgi:hypothetical protein